MTRPDIYTHTEADAARYERAHADECGRFLGGKWYDAEDLPDLSDVAE